MKILNITNGSISCELMVAAAIDGDRLSWDDVLHEGPVAGELELAKVSAGRAAYLAGLFELEHAEAIEKFNQRDKTIAQFAQYDLLRLWFEHDLYDQLQLIQILDWLRRQDLSGVQLELINPGKYLGYHTPKEFAELQSLAVSVSKQQLELAASAWQAFTSPTPEKLNHLVRQDLSSLQYLRPALIRLMQEYPWQGSGLGLTEQMALQCLSEKSLPLADLFKAYQQKEAARFMGDSTFAARLKRMSESEYPLLELPHTGRGPLDWQSTAPLVISATGKSVLNNEIDWFQQAGKTTFVGGCLISQQAAWRWQPDDESITLANR